MKTNHSVTTSQVAKSWRLWLVVLAFVSLAVVMLVQMLSLNFSKQEFLQNQGDARTIRTMLIPAHRGLITDRNGEPLAVSAPVASIWMDPKFFDASHPQMANLAKALELNLSELLKRATENESRRFVYLRRHVTPELADNVRLLEVPGINVDREYRRFYPAGEVTGHLVGFTNIDGQGQEGFELAYNEHLRSENGSKLVLRDRVGRTIRHIQSMKEASQGHDLQLSIDMPLQYMAYRELKAAVETHGADSGTLVMLDAKNGEVLAMVNQPAFNPNDRSQLNPDAIRNRALTDMLEPGSTVKPFTVAAALSSGKFSPTSVIDTTPGSLRLASFTVRDFRNYGKLDLEGIITKSSNVGVVRLIRELEHGSLTNLLTQVGFGQSTMTGFPGEMSGVLPFLSSRQWVERAAMSYGYGLSATPLQIAQSYIPLAADGEMYPVSLLKKTQHESQRVLPKGIGRQVLHMMETVVSTEGTAKQAAVDGYRVAGKTGTVRRNNPNGGYKEDEYTAVFAGIAPVSDPRFIVVVVVDNPKGQEYYGGNVSAPVFSRVIAGAMRLYNINPDNWPEGLEVAKK